MDLQTMVCGVLDLDKQVYNICNLIIGYNSEQLVHQIPLCEPETQNVKLILGYL